jgi:hydrogenase maturation protease
LSTLVLGLGNLVHSDDGVGVHAIHLLQLDSRVPASATLIDGGTQGLSLIPHISGFSRVLVIDAVNAGEAPGTLLRFEGRALSGLPGKATVHQLGFADLMIAMSLLEEAPEDVVVVGIQPVSTDWGAELTPQVRKTLPSLLDAVIEQLRSWEGVAERNGRPESATAH